MTRILTAYSWEHENPAGDTWIAGWGIWNNEHDEPIIYDGFATEQLALAGIDILLKAADVLGTRTLRHDQLAQRSDDWFLRTFGHTWAKAPCPEDCIICAWELT